MVVPVFKSVGQTPLEVLEAFLREYPEHKNSPTSYAGRLDPMAEGILLLLIGEDTKKQQNFQNLDKEYVAEILFGVSTDSFDLLGLVEEMEKVDVAEEEMKQAVESFVGEVELSVPPFSSYAIKGKPLFWWAREDRLDEIDLPSKSTEIYKVEIIGTKDLSGEALLSMAVDQVQKVSGDFRQKEIVERWKETLGSAPETTFPVVKARIKCSSGTYIRSIAHEVGEKLDIPSLLLSLKRTKVGEFTLNNLQ